MKISLSLFLLTFIFFQILNAQDLHLTSGNKTKTIKAGTFIEVELVSSLEACVGCPHVAIGELISYDSATVNLRTKYIREIVYDEKHVPVYQTKQYKKADMPVLSFPAKEILSIKIKGRNKIRRTPAGKVLGEILVLMGLSNIISSPVARIEDHNAGDLMLKLGATEFFAGVILTEIFDQKVYYMNQNSRQKGYGNKIWVLN